MADTALRKEILGYIDNIPDRKLALLKPLLSELSEPKREEDAERIIEPANFWERMIHKKRMREYKKNPDCFVPFDPYR